MHAVHGLIETRNMETIGQVEFMMIRVQFSIKYIRTRAFAVTSACNIEGIVRFFIYTHCKIQGNDFHMWALCFKMINGPRAF